MDDASFNELYATMSGQVYSFACRRLGSEAAKEVVSATFETAWQKRDQFPVDQKDRNAWVVGIAKNKVLQEQQRRARKHHDNRFSADWLPLATEPSDEDIARLVVDRDSAVRVYESLTPSEQLVFDVAFFRDLNSELAATVLGISTTAFTSRLSRLRGRLRALSEGDSLATEPGGTA